MATVVINAQKRIIPMVSILVRPYVAMSMWRTLTIISSTDTDTYNRVLVDAGSGCHA